MIHQRVGTEWKLRGNQEREAHLLEVVLKSVGTDVGSDVMDEGVSVSWQVGWYRDEHVVSGILETAFYHTEKSTEGGFREDLSRLSRRSQGNKKLPAMRVGKKSYTVESPFRIE